MLWPPVDRGRRPGSFAVVALAGLTTLGLVWFLARPSAEPLPVPGAIGSDPMPAPLRPSPALLARVTPELAELRRDLREVLPSWRTARWSILVVSLDRGDTLWAVAPDEPMTPASNMKLITTAAALHHLGAEYRFRTFLLSDGQITDGRLEGDLVLYGTGDPGLSDRFYPTGDAVFQAMADSLLESGVFSVNGDLIGDGSYFGGPLLGPQWDPRDLNEWFAAPVSALTFNENIVTLRISPSARVGGLPVVEEDPAGAGFSFRNGAETVQTRPRPRLWLERLSPTEPIRLEGELRIEGRAIWRRLTVSDPVLFAARGLTTVLEGRGIAIRGSTRALEPGERSRITGPKKWAPRRREMRMEVIAVHESPPLSQYLEVMNHVSHNLFAEAVLKTLGRVVGGEGSFEAGVRVVRGFLSNEVGVPAGSVHASDGSGLSGENSVTAGAFVRLLAYMAESEHWEAFLSTLPVAGRRRGLPRMYRTLAAGNLRAKTGTIEGVSALTGVVESTTGERILFSILANGVPSTSAAKRVEDRIAIRLAELDRPLPPPELEAITGG